ncbi:MAG: putative DNA binding domain-containing protein [Azoarcus sp.]|jgi:ATP-dependent DNA helicase RecG|nr:putative DNA binding domain-containing protein [Azoarcus sp.]
MAISNNKLPINLNDLLHQRTVEGERIEYKAGWNPDAIIPTLCAFANDFENLGGGYIIIGQDCDDNGQPIFPPVGLPANKIDKIQRELLMHCQLIQPPYFPVLSLEVVEGRKLIVLRAPGGQTRPYKAPGAVTAKNKVWKYFIRRYSSTVEAKGDTEQELLSLAAKVPFDDRFKQSAHIGDLSKPLMQDFLQEVGSALAADTPRLSVEALGRQMNVAGGPAESPWPKNVGLLFFNETPEQFFPGVQIDVVWFPEDAGGDRFGEKIFKGPLARMTREALSYIQRNYLHETVIKHSDRAEATRAWNFPYAAVEEAVVNAVFHRSYEEREPIEVRISHDELVVVSYPGPDRSVRMGDLKAGRAVSRRYRNRRIGEFLKELEMTEGRSTGIPKILKAMAANGSPAPLFETDDDRSAFTIRLPCHPLVLIPTANYPQATPQVTPQVTVRDLFHAAYGPQVTPQVTPQVGALLARLDDEATRQAMQDALGLADREHFRKTYLVPALELGMIEMTQPDKPNSRSQRYRLTASGRQWLAANSDNGSH